MAPHIEIPVELNTPVCIVKSNQHDGAWVEAKLFELKDLNSWGTYVFATYTEATAACNSMNKWLKQ